MNDHMQAYGLWGLVLINSLVFIIFAFSFFKPNSPRDWRTFGTFAAFIDCCGGCLEQSLASVVYFSHKQILVKNFQP